MSVSFDGTEFIAIDYDQVDDDQPLDEATERIVHNDKKYLTQREPDIGWSPAHRKVTCPAPMCAWRGLVRIPPDGVKIDLGVLLVVGAGDPQYMEDLEHEGSGNYTGEIQMRMSGPGYDTGIVDFREVQPTSITGSLQYYTLSDAVPERARGTTAYVSVWQRDAVGALYRNLENTGVGDDGLILNDRISDIFPPTDWDPSYGWAIEHPDQGSLSLPLSWDTQDPESQEQSSDIHSSHPCHKVTNRGVAELRFASWMSIQSVHMSIERHNNTISTDLSQMQGGEPYEAQTSSHVHGREIQREGRRPKLSAIGQTDWEPVTPSDPASVWKDGEAARWGWYLPDHETGRSTAAQAPLVSTREWDAGTTLEARGSMVCGVRGGELITVGRDEEYEPSDIGTVDAGEILIQTDWRVVDDSGVLGSVSKELSLPLVPADCTGAWPLLQAMHRCGAGFGKTSVAEHFREGYLHPTDLGLLEIVRTEIPLNTPPQGAARVEVIVSGASVEDRPSSEIIDRTWDLTSTWCLVTTDLTVQEKPQ